MATLRSLLLHRGLAVVPTDKFSFDGQDRLQVTLDGVPVEFEGFSFDTEGRLKITLDGAFVTVTDLTFDGNGNLRVAIDGGNVTISGAAFDSTDRLRTSLYGKSSVAGDTAVKVLSNGSPVVAVAMEGSFPLTANTEQICPANSDGNHMSLLATVPYLYNGGSRDIATANWWEEVLASAARGATVSSPTITNYNHRGAYILIDVTDYTGSPAITPRFDVYSPMTGAWTEIANLSVINTIGTFAKVLYPATYVGATGNYDGKSYVLPRQWRVRLVFSGSGTITYQVVVSHIL